MLLEEIVRKYHVNLYTSEPITTCTPETWEFPALNHQDKRWPNREVNALEIKQALAQMDSKKVPGIDGLSAGFFRNNGTRWALQLLILSRQLFELVLSRQRRTKL